MLEKLLFRKVELWLLLLVIILGALGTVLFGFLAVRGAAAGSIGATALEIAKFPSTVREAFQNKNNHESKRTWPGQVGGFSLEDGFAPSKRAMVLLSRYDGDQHVNVTELLYEGSADVLAAWKFADPNKFKYTPRSRFHTEITSDPATMRAYHPWLDTDGSLTFHFRYSPIYRFDQCSNVVWVNDDFAYHHSIEKDAIGNLWSPGTSHQPMTKLGFDNRLFDDHIVQFSPAGKTLYSKSVIEILIENDLLNRMYVYHRYVTDPIHLNDIQPVLQDGPYWLRGDVFLSIAHLNMIMLFRPGTNELVWWTQTRMAHQHDVDVIDNQRIAVFNNNRTTRASGYQVIGHNEVLVFDLADDSFESPWSDAFRRLDIRTISQGLADLGQDGSLLVEESNYGRLVKFSADGDLEWQYYNKNSNGVAYTLNWMRYLDEEFAAKVVDNLNKESCDQTN